MSSAQNRDIVVIGASAGGLDALAQLLAGLPPELPATLFVVQHMSPVHQSRLPELLSKHGPFRALHPIHGQEIAPQHIYVAPPDMQLLLRPGYLDVVRGPKENGHRPAVDALFRTAARAYGPRVIGVVLTGYLDCGTAGLLSIKARGGLALVQDPESASVPEMPASAIQNVKVDEVVPLPRLAEALVKLVQSPAGALPSTLPATISQLEGDQPGPLAPVVCPSCRGALNVVEHGSYEIYRCHVGHTFSQQSMLAEHTDATERALWAAVRALEESAGLADRMASRNTGDLGERFREKHETLNHHAALVRRILLGGEREAPVLKREDEELH